MNHEPQTPSAAPFAPRPETPGAGGVPRVHDGEDGVALNHLKQVSMTRGGTTQTRTFTYDSSTQRLTQATTPDAGTVQYSYNPDGTLLSKTDALGQQTQYTYDVLARVTQVSYLPNFQEDICQRVTYQYDGYPGGDPLNYVAFNYPIGRLTRMSWSGGPGCAYQFQEEHAYDAQGRVFERVLTMTNAGYPGPTPITLTSTFHYDAEGRLTESWYPITSNPNDTFGYATDHDALGRQIYLYLETAQHPPVVSNVTYNAAGQLTAMTTNAYTETLQYNANLQLVRLTATPTGGQGIDFTYKYPTTGNNGRISQMTDNLSGEQVR